MKKPLFALLLLLLSLQQVALCQNINELMAAAKQLEKNQQQEEALGKYQQVLKLQPTNLTGLVKCSELCSLIGNRQHDKRTKISYFNAAKKYARVALQLNANSAEANFVMAMAMGRMAIISSGKSKIEAVKDIKKYAERCVELDPTSYKGFHVLGKWHYEVSRLTSFEKTAARVLFGALPASSFAEAIKYYEKSKTLAPDLNLNYLELARAYHANNQNDKAITYLKQLVALPERAPDDAKVKSEGVALLKELQR
jgi:tetratricopeptide (TPR) repeat protein